MGDSTANDAHPFLADFEHLRDVPDAHTGEILAVLSSRWWH